MATETVSTKQLEQLKTLHAKCKEWLALAEKNEATLPAAYKKKIEKRLKQITALGQVSAKAYRVNKPKGEEDTSKDSFLNKVVDTVVDTIVPEEMKAIYNKIESKLTQLAQELKEREKSINEVDTNMKRLNELLTGI